MCLSSDVTIVELGERGEAVGQVDGRAVRVRLDLLVIEGLPVEVGDVVRVDCGFALELVTDPHEPDGAFGAPHHRGADR